MEKVLKVPQEDGRKEVKMMAGQMHVVVQMMLCMQTEYIVYDLETTQAPLQLRRLI
jgi:hypothetical protein